MLSENIGHQLSSNTVPHPRRIENLTVVHGVSSCTSLSYLICHMIAETCIMYITEKFM